MLSRVIAFPWCLFSLLLWHHFMDENYLMHRQLNTQVTLGRVRIWNQGFDCQIYTCKDSVFQSDWEAYYQLCKEKKVNYMDHAGYIAGFLGDVNFSYSVRKEFQPQEWMVILTECIVSIFSNFYKNNICSNITQNQYCVQCLILTQWHSLPLSVFALLSWSII